MGLFEVVNPVKLLRKLYPPPATVSKDAVTQAKSFADMDKTEQQVFAKIGIIDNELNEAVSNASMINFERSQIYKEVDRAILHWMVGCLRGSTKIRLCSGESVCIEDMANSPDEFIGKYVWSVDPITSQLEPDEILAVQKTRKKAELVRVHLDNGEYIDCTPDHKFLLRRKERRSNYREASKLKAGDSLMPFYSKLNEGKILKGYEKVYNPGSGRWHFAHRLVVKFFNPTYLCRKSTIIHHKNFSCTDNDPSNLQVMSHSEHASLHFKIAIRRHKEGCMCGRCVMKRGDKVQGIGFPIGNIPWNKGLTATTDARVAKVAEDQRGRTVSEEQKEQLRQANLGKVRSEEAKRKTSETLKGRARSELTKRKIAATLKGREHSEVRRRNQSIGQRLRYHKVGSLKLELPRRSYEYEITEQKVMNHKVTKVEKLLIKEDVYDLSTKKNHNFSLESGVIVHNSSAELYADVASTYSPLHNRTAWITSSNAKYEVELTKLLDRIGIEEKIFDWAWTIATYGDLFVEVEGVPGLGVTSIRDDDHPIGVSRVDSRGMLIGFFETPLGYVQSGVTADGAGSSQLLPPWQYSHFRLLGAKRKRPMGGDPGYTEYRTISLMGTETRRLTSRYGTSLLINALPAYKRLRLAEDSMLLSRLTRGITKYIYKLKVDSKNVEAADAMISEYVALLKRARAIDSRDASPGYDSKCLRGDTGIRLCSGEDVTIKKIVEEKDNYLGKFVWSVNPDTLKVEPTKILDAKKTRKNAELVRVHLDNDEHIDCTPDHPFMLRNKKRRSIYREASKLQSGDSLMPFYSKLNKRVLEGYEVIYGPNHKVVKVERLNVREDTYDITVEKNHNFSTSAGVFLHNSNFMASVEDLIIPVWGDAGDLTIDKIGGDPDVKWIADIDELRNQLAAALRTPLSLLGSHVEEATGALGSSAIEKLDIRFARSARRLQRSLKEGITRICQIHLSYMNMKADTELFEVNLSETSMAEEEEMRESLNQGTDVVMKFMDMLDTLDVNLDKPKVMDYLNQKFLRLGDFKIEDFIKEGKVDISKPVKFARDSIASPITNMDLKTWKPNKDNKKLWEDKYSNVPIKFTVEKVEKKAV